jgi:uncharacterized protein (TIGR02001 family)
MSKRGLILVGLLAASGTAAAADSPHTFTWTAYATTDYVFRGVSQNSENATLQAAFDYGHESGFYAGIWGSRIDFGSAGPDAEVDTYVGFAFPIADVLKGDVQFIRYNYVGGNNGSDFAYNELVGKLTFNDFLTGTLGYSNDVFAGGETGIYYGLSAKHGWESGFTVFGGVGYYDLNSTYVDSDSYVDWNLGVSQTFGPAEVALTYTDTNDDGSTLFTNLAGNRVFLSAKVSF